MPTDAMNRPAMRMTFNESTAADVPIRHQSSRVSKCDDQTGMNQVLVYRSIMKT